MNKTCGILLSVYLLFILAGCSSTMTASADNVFENVLASSNDSKDYYAEGKMVVYQGEELLEQSQFQIYASSEGKRKILTKDKENGSQTITVNDGEQVISYEKGADTAISIAFPEGENPPVMAPKDELTWILDTMRDSHDYEIKGEEEVLGLNTYHMVLTAQKQDSILGDMEFWVDPKTWLVVKSVSQAGDIRSETTYNQIELSPEFDQTTFKLELPDGVTVEAIDPASNVRTGTVAHVEEAMGQPFYVFPDDSAVIENIDIRSLTGLIEREEAEIIYMINDFPAISISIFPTPEESGTSLTESEWSVRGKNADYMKEINALMWDEDGLRYSLMIQNPEMSVEEIIALTDTMILSSER